MKFEEWPQDERGNLLVAPLMQHAVLPAHLHVLARIWTAHHTPGSPEPELRSLELGMTPEQARALGQALCEAARRVREGVGGSA